MISITQLITIFCVSIDGFCCGGALGFEKHKLTLPLIAAMAAISTAMTFVAMLIGELFFGLISPKVCAYFSALTFFFLAFMAAWQKGDDCKKLTTWKAALLGGVAVAVDASIAAFAMAVSGASPWLFSILFGIAHFICIGLGYLAAGTAIGRRISAAVPSLAAIIFTALGIVRLI